MTTVTLGGGYRMTLPPEICEPLGLVPGSTLDVEVLGGQIVMRPGKAPMTEKAMGYTPESQDLVARALKTFGMTGR